MCQFCIGVCLALPDHVEVVRIQTSEELVEFANNLLSTQAIIALDVEWRPSATEPALLQVATEEAIALIDLLALRRYNVCPAILRDILMREQVVRLGWRFETDLRVLASWMPCLNSVHGYIEVSDLVLPVTEPAASGDSLAGLVHRSMGLRLCKRLQCSNWESRPLSADQVSYAALDAYALLLLTERALQLPDIKVLELGNQKKLQSKSCKASRVPRTERMQVEVSTPKGNLTRNPEKRMAFITRFCVRAQVYSNCRILSSSGALVAHCDRAKAEWYLSKGIARRVGDVEPLTVQLSFCPEERAEEYDEIASKNPRVNRCVVCGAEQNLSRFHLVPKAYQRYFDVRLKAHQCHDIVLLCVDCHEISNRHVMSLKITFCREYDAPLKGVGRTVPSAEERNVVKAASALLRGVDRVPPARVTDLQNIVRNWLNVQVPEMFPLHEATLSNSAVHREALMYAARLGKDLPRRGGWQAASVNSDNFQSHGEIVVSKVMKSGGFAALHEFMVRWREHFLRTMAPRYMPDDWRMDYCVSPRNFSSYRPADVVVREEIAGPSPKIVCPWLDIGEHSAGGKA